jgi:hypothetical protein
MRPKKSWLNFLTLGSIFKIVGILNMKRIAVAIFGPTGQVSTFAVHFIEEPNVFLEGMVILES